MSLDLKQFQTTFFEESFEALDGMELALLELRPGEIDAECVNTIFRAAHSIKGGAGMFGFAEVTSFTHAAETYLDALRGGCLPVSQPGIDALLKSVDLLRSMLSSVQQGHAIDAQPATALQSELERLLHASDPQDGAGVESGRRAPAAAGLGCAAKPQPCGWRIEFKPHAALFQQGNDPVRLFGELQRLGALEPSVELGHLPTLATMNSELCYLAWDLKVHGESAQADVEEIFEWVADDCQVVIQALDPAGAAQSSQSAPLATAECAANSIASRQEISAPQARQGESGSIRVGIEKIDELINKVSELVITQSMLTELGGGGGGTGGNLLQTGLERLERNTRDLQESVMRMRMLPINVVFSRFPRMVHDLSRTLGKQVDLVLRGEQTELDKTVLEKIGDPLVHLLRNAIDHGIEAPETRRRLGKPEAGCLKLEAFHKSGSITIRLSDDGSGLDCKKILTKAKSAGLVGDEELSDEATCDLIFLPGLSTAEKTTDLSGRGVGMDVVRKNIRALGGSIEVSSEPGRGTTFSISLPLTLAIMDGQSVALGDESYIIPLVSIVESLQPKPELVETVAKRGEVFLFRGVYVPILHLDEVFATRSKARSPGEGLIVIVESEGRRFGILVDELLGQQQIVIKSLEQNYRKVEGISGATILSGGSVALILDIPELLRIAHERGAADRQCIG
ncbi:MAG: chemotaxis protein CheA [Nitrococcus sp.]|nr:chemotaxis protein CheA [Nitrococcus sp.]